MSANQLLSKALSTESEDEAISCLKMARKKGLKLEEDLSKGYYDRKLKEYEHTVASLEKYILDKLRLNTNQRKEIHRLECSLEDKRDKLYTYYTYLITTAAVILAELIVIILMAIWG